MKLYTCSLRTDLKQVLRGFHYCFKTQGTHIVFVVSKETPDTLKIVDAAFP